MRWVTRLRAAIALGSLLGLSACVEAQPIPIAPTGQSSSPVATPPSDAGSSAQQNPAPEPLPIAQEMGDSYLNLLRDRVDKYLPMSRCLMGELKDSQ